jgi:hypothetical protein
LWSFVGCKARVRWLWIALCRRTRQVVGYVFGDRSEATCRRLWKKIPEGYREALCYTDFWEAYRNVVPEEQHEPVGKDSGSAAGELPQQIQPDPHTVGTWQTLRERFASQRHCARAGTAPYDTAAPAPLRGLLLRAG